MEIGNIKKERVGNEKYTNWNENTLECSAWSRWSKWELEDKEAEITQLKQQKNKIQKSKNSIRSLWKNFKHTNICIVGLPEGKDRASNFHIRERIITENFPNPEKEIDIQVQEAQINSKRPTPRHTIIKMPKIKYRES